MRVLQDFWPALPFYIPYSVGMPNWWDMVWWLYQLGLMSGVLWVLYGIARWVDRNFLEQSADPDGCGDEWKGDM